MITITNTKSFIFGLFSLITLASSVLAQDKDASGMKVSASVDMTADFKGNRYSTARDKFGIREAELILYGPIDHLFYGSLSMAAHQEDGVSLFEVHEAYIGSERLVDRMNLKVGQYFLGIGRLNRFHRHEWPFIFAPKIHQELFGSEALLDSGAELSYLTPTSFYLDLTVGVSNGWVFGHSHDEGEKPKSPTAYIRIATYSDLTESMGSQLGLSYLNRKDALDIQTQIAGLDFTAKLRRSDYLNLLIQSELWFRRLENKSLSSKEDVLGAYLLTQYGISSALYFGVRADYYSPLSLEKVNGDKLEQYEFAVNPILTWKPSEFGTFRFAVKYEKLESDLNTEALRGKDRLSYELQTTFNLGAHPSHEF